MASPKRFACMLPTPLAERLERYAEGKNLTKSQVARAAFRSFLDYQETRDARWTQLRTAGAAAMRRAGIRSDLELQAVLYEMRHGRPEPLRPDGRSSGGS